MGLVLEAGGAHALPALPSLRGGQRSCRNSVVVLCVIKLLKTKSESRFLPGGMGGPVGLVARPPEGGVGALGSHRFYRLPGFGVVAAPALKVPGDKQGFPPGDQGTVGWVSLSPLWLPNHAFLEQDQ